jgi:1-acyl-sn-glycerol-3-phosphate acyltransferase
MPRQRLAVWGRLLGVGLLVLWIGVLLGAGGLVLAPFPRARRRFRIWLFQAGPRWLLGCLRVEVGVAGPPPTAPFFLVANHLSYLDVLVLASQVPGCVFVAKEEIRSWPLLGPICHGFGTIFIDREDRRNLPCALRRIEEALSDGDGIVLFPEGTSSPGATVSSFRSPLLALTARSASPVHAAAIGYRSPEACWWGEAELVPHLLDLCRLPRIEATVEFCAEPVAGTDRKRLAAELRAAVLARFQAVPGSSPLMAPATKAPGRLTGGWEWGRSVRPCGGGAGGAGRRRRGPGTGRRGRSRRGSGPGRSAR